MVAFMAEVTLFFVGTASKALVMALEADTWWWISFRLVGHHHHTSQPSRGGGWSSRLLGVTGSPWQIVSSRKLVLQRLKSGHTIIGEETRFRGRFLVLPVMSNTSSLRWYAFLFLRGASFCYRWSDVFCFLPTSAVDFQDVSPSLS